MERRRRRGCKEKQRCQDRGKRRARLRADPTEHPWAPQGFQVFGFPHFPQPFPPLGSALAICDFDDIRKELVPCDREVG